MSDEQPEFWKTQVERRLIDQADQIKELQEDRDAILDALWCLIPKRPGVHIAKPPWQAFIRAAQIIWDHFFNNAGVNNTPNPGIVKRAGRDSIERARRITGGEPPDLDESGKLVQRRDG